MPVYNGGQYLAESVKSILKQSFKEFEFIIINDGSNDQSPAILEDFAKKDDRIRLIHQDNMGLIKTLNKGIYFSSGKYIARMDADDISLPDRLQKQIAFLENHPEVGFVGTGCHIIDETSSVIGERIYPVRDEELRKALISYNPFIHSSIMIRREVFDKVGVYDENRLRVEDYELWLRAERYFKLANLDDILLLYRIRQDSVCTIFENEQYRFAIGVRIEAIKNRQYPLWAVIYLIEPTLILITPKFMKKILRRYLFKRKVCR